ncbi:TrpB-like pyridoxal phosphate-dependent enzyme [Peptococcus simiae]|uniref:TrpB-like pyridoxal phosphate-dependent enzyme n=1 Tax=Peptococcus simiae TaxID=1643805 RepID=UPI00397F2860
MTKIPNRIYLTEDEMPTRYYNLRADMTDKPAPLLNPATGQPVSLDDLKPIFCEALARQELDDDTPYVDIPEPIQDFYKKYRPSPLCRAYSLEKYLDTPAKIYYKFEGNNTSGSHKLNSAVAQVYYAREEGIRRLTTETGAGQWGTALAEACAHFGIDLSVYMVKCSYEQKPFRKAIMETFNSRVIPSPSDTTAVGRQILADHPGATGSLGCAIAEAVEEATSREDSRYVLGSVLNQVVLHQSIIGLECERAFAKIDDYPDTIIGCAGGGSNLGGLIAPFMRDKLQGKYNPDILAVEPASCPSMTRGKYAYDFCDTGEITPLAKMYTLGAGYIPAASHAGGLRFHGMSPIVSKLYDDGFLRAKSYKQTDIFAAAVLFARLETILPAPESAHAIKGAIDEALACKESGETKTILFGLTGTGYFDMTAYAAYTNQTMTDYLPTDAELAEALDRLPVVPGQD